LAQTTQSYRFILGCRDTQLTGTALEGISYEKAKHNVKLLPLDLSNLKTVKSFASDALTELGNDKLDCLFLNAALITHSNKGEAGPHNSKWGASCLVNHFSQHYLIHLLHDKLASSESSRVVVVSSGAIQMQKETDSLEETLKAGSGADLTKIYPASKFVQLLGTLYWRRHFQQAKSGVQVIATSPGLIPGTGLARNADFKLSMDMPGAKAVSDGAKSLIGAIEIQNIPEEEEKIFLTSWGEWWEPSKEYPLALNKELQSKWSPGLAELEKDAGM